MSIATPRRSRLDPSGPAALRATRPDRAAAIRGGSPARLRRTLENLRLEAQRARRIDRDPLRLVLAYATPGDREVAGLLAALLAYGRVDLLAAHTRTVLGYLGGRPARRLRRGVPQLPPLSYRFHETRDLLALLRGVRALLLRHGSLGEAFGLRWRREADLRKALAGFADELRAESGPAGPGLRFLLADPARGGACKRWHLFLRWMARSAPGDPDTGIWNGILPQSVLLVPLDTHIVRVGRRLGLTARRTVDWKMAEEITA